MVDATVTAVDRGRVRADENYVLEGARMASASDPDPETSIVETPVYNLVVDHPEATVLWDTGSHPEAGNGHWPAPLYDAFKHYDADERTLDVALAEVGYALDDVDAVVMSHLHVDHAGGLYHFDGTDIPVFVHAEELAHAYLSAKTDAGGDAYLAADFDHDLNWQVLRRDRERHFADLEFVRLPGHTPGLVGMVLHLDAGTYVFAGDQAYVRENYDDGHPLGAGLTWSQRDWRDSLHLVRSLARRHDATVFTGHDPGDFERLQDGLPQASV